MTRPGSRLRALLALAIALGTAPPSTARSAELLDLSAVLGSVRSQYPPLLAVLVERDIAAGRLESAQGAFDLNVIARLYGVPAGFYRYGTADVGVEQFTGLFGSTVFGGYRITRGDRLPDYYWNRTQGAGEPRVGVAIPLLRDGSIDRRRAAILAARLDQELADPAIARQQIEFVRAATVSYFNLIAAARRWELAEELLRIANDRTAALERQADAGLVPRIVLTDNRRLVVAREIGVVQARRRFEGAALTLSLFYRTADGEPIVATRGRVPGAFPDVRPADLGDRDSGVERALAHRPELRRLELEREKLEVERALARNQMQPNLDARVALSQDFGEDLYPDKSDFEVEVGVEFRLPVQRREATGRVAELDGRLDQMSAEQRFARERIGAEVADVHSALLAAHEQLSKTHLNAELALELQSAEEERFRRGAVDLLALQIREQAAFDAQTLAVDAVAEYFRALADYEAATAVELTRRGDRASR